MVFCLSTDSVLTLLAGSRQHLFAVWSAEPHPVGELERSLQSQRARGTQPVYYADSPCSEGGNSCFSCVPWDSFHQVLGLVCRLLVCILIDILDIFVYEFGLVPQRTNAEIRLFCGCSWWTWWLGGLAAGQAFDSRSHVSHIVSTKFCIQMYWYQIVHRSHSMFTTHHVIHLRHSVPCVVFVLIFTYWAIYHEKTLIFTLIIQQNTNTLSNNI